MENCSDQSSTAPSITILERRETHYKPDRVRGGRVFDLVAPFEIPPFLLAGMVGAP